ncbi:MAG TPA: ABC transporter substrate-binding protein [Streptomyces sp.]|nr:ABC transporter substrate-binding protein [Streptomyces sp.]
MKRAARVRTSLAVALVTGAMLTSGCASPAGGKSDGGKEPAAERGRYEFGLIGKQAEGGKPVRGGTLNFADYAEARSLSPAVTYATGSSGGSAMAAVYDVLIRYNSETNKYEPWLAESLESNKDATVWTLKLRHGVTFSDGTPLDAKAVVGSITWYQKNKGADTSLLAPNIAKMEATDDSTVVFTLRTPWGTFPGMLARSVGMIVAPAAYADKEFKPIGAGPFVLDKYAPQEEMVLKANKKYWKGAPHLDALRFFWPQSDEAKLDALNDGTADVALVRNAKVVDQAVKAGQPGELTLYGMGNVININNREGRPGHDVRVRKAIALALDPDMETTRSYDGKGLPGKELLAPESKWHSSVKPLGTDIEQAKKLVTEAKQDGFDGKLTYMDGTDPLSRTRAVVLKAMLERAGFTVTLDLVPSIADRVKKMYVDHDFDLSRGAASISEGDPYYGLENSLNSKSFRNASGYANPEMDKELAKLHAAVTDEQAQKAIDGIQTLANETVPVVNLGANATFAAWGENVHGIVPTDEAMTLFSKAWIGK